MRESKSGERKSENATVIQIFKRRNTPRCDNWAEGAACAGERASRDD